MTLRKGVVLVATLLCLGLALFWFYRPTGPEYGGKHLSTWLKSYNYESSQAEIAIADQAVRALGTNAIPYLLDLLHKNDSKFYAFVSRKLGVNFETLPKPLAPAEVDYDRVVRAFKALGPVGKVAIPELIKILQNPEDQGGGVYVSRILASFGAESVQPLREVLNAKSDVVQRRAINGLVRIGARLSAATEPAIPDIIKLLDSPNLDTRRSAVSALDTIATNAPGVVPALAKKLNDPDEFMADDATRALSKCGTQATNAVPYLLAILDARGQERLENTQDLVSLLCKLAPDEAEKRAVQILTKFLTSKRRIYYGNFAKLLSEIPNSRKVATPLLINQLNEDFTDQTITWTLRVLSRIGPDAKEALPMLQALAKDLQKDSEPQNSESATERSNALTAWKSDSRAKPLLASALYAIAPQETFEQVEAMLIDQFDREPKGLAGFVLEFDECLKGRSAPVFMAMLDSPEFRVRKYGLRALKWLGPEASQAVPKIKSFTEENPQAQPEEQELRTLALSAMESILHPNPNAAWRR